MWFTALYSCVAFSSLPSLLFLSMQDLPWLYGLSCCHLWFHFLPWLLWQEKKNIIVIVLELAQHSCSRAGLASWLSIFQNSLIKSSAGYGMKKHLPWPFKQKELITKEVGVLPESVSRQNRSTPINCFCFSLMACL